MYSTVVEVNTCLESWIHVGTETGIHHVWLGSYALADLKLDFVADYATDWCKFCGGSIAVGFGE